MERLQVLVTVGRDRRLRLLVGGLLGFSIAEAATWLAILIYANQQGGAAETGLVAVSQLVPPGVVAPLAGFASDRFRRDRVLAVGSALQAVTMTLAAVAMAVGAPSVVVYGAGALATSAMTLSRPATWALFPWVCARPEQLTAANVSGSLAESLGLLLGPAVGAGLIALSGPGLAFGAMAGVMALVTVAAVVVQVDHAPSTTQQHMTIGDVGREVVAGVRVVASTGSGTVVAFMGLGFVLMGAVDVGAVIAVTEILDRSESVAGLLTTGTGFGAVIGAMASVLLVGRARLITPMLAAAALAGLSFSIAASSNLLALTLVLFALNGIGAQAMETIGKTMTQRSTSDDVLARVFGLVESLTMLAMAVGAALIAVLAAWLGARQAMVATGLFVPVAATLMARSLAVIDRATVPPDAERIDALQGVAMFEPLALPVIEQLALNMEPIEAPAGSLLFTQGDLADHVTVIGRGELEIRRDGRTVAHVGPGEHVGEVGVLRGRPRNATVLAHTDVQGWTIDRTVFLEAVTGHPQSLAAAESVTVEREP